MKKMETEILIIGAGASGLAAAWNLSKSRFKIYCFDQGAIINNKEFSLQHKNWEQLIQKKYNHNPNIRKMTSDYPIDNKNSPIHISNFNSIGGSTILYSGHFLRFHPSDFKVKTLDNIACDWPINYQELEKYYELNEKNMKIAGLTGDKAYPKMKKFSKPVELGILGETIANGFNKLGWHWWPSYSAVATKKYKGRKKGSVSDAYNAYYKKALKNGVKFFQNHRAVKIKVDKLGNAEGAIYFDEKNNKKFCKASLIILACSAIGTPRLLLNSRNKFFPRGLANSSGMLGKNLMLHPLGYLEATFEKYLESFKGIKGNCIFSHEFYETNKKNNFKRGYTIHILRETGALNTAMSMRKFRELPFGKDFHYKYHKKYGHTVPVAIICEDFPKAHNYLKLDKKNKDSNGMPGIKIYYKLSKNTKNMMAHGLKKGSEVLRAAGAKSIRAFGPVKNTGWHIMGTAKMGNSKKNSVVNKYGQTHDIKNLMIVDSSVFPTSSGVNPGSTIFALSLKITDKIIKKPNLFFV
tara:strand:- start:336 stop:1901 length:1566 start_codon:yes stop_codon:yes gene_type:complete